MVIKKSKLSFEEKKWSIFFLLPAFIFISFSYIYPMLYSLVLSFNSYTMLIPNSNPVFVGLKNYLDAFKSMDFLNSIKISFIFSFFSVIFEFIMGLF